MKAFSHINIGEKISFIIGCKNYYSKKTDIPCANCKGLVHNAQVLIWRSKLQALDTARLP